MNRFISPEAEERLIRENNKAFGDVGAPRGMANLELHDVHLGHDIMHKIMRVATPDEIPTIDEKLAKEGVEFRMPPAE